MIAKFPEILRRKSGPEVPKLLPEGHHSHDEEHYAWVQWLFQRMRGEADHLFFTPSSRDLHRLTLLREWDYFIQHLWSSVLAPALLESIPPMSPWNEDQLRAIQRKLKFHMVAETFQQSLFLGQKLLEVTSRAKYQGALGRCRQAVAEGRIESHLVTVWAAISHLFQLHPKDALVGYLQEEWRAATRFHASQCAAPAGAKSVERIVGRNLKASFVEAHWGPRLKS